MSVKIHKTYETVDGKKFLDPKVAEKHADYLDFLQFFLSQYGFCTQIGAFKSLGEASRQATDLMYHNPDKAIEALNLWKS